MSHHADGPTLPSGQRLTTAPTIVLLGGLPASGKSTLARQLVKHYPKNAIHLEYDELEDSLASTMLENDRREAWNLARQMALKQLEEQLLENGRTYRIFLVDDNFHLRGMRKQIHRLLLRYKPIRFGIIWLATPKEECLRRNQGRKRRIPVHVMEKMNQIIEPPRAAWEENWLNVDQKTPIEAITRFIDECWDIIDLPDAIDHEQQEVDRQGTLASQSHNWDKILRGWVGKVAIFDKRLARKANEARKEVIRSLKPKKCDLCREENICDLFVSFVLPDSQRENKLQLLKLLKDSK
jgi:tRNA uridine 5-carbamoylmethylation protein Kti12